MHVFVHAHGDLVWRTAQDLKWCSLGDTKDGSHSSTDTQSLLGVAHAGKSDGEHPQLIVSSSKRLDVLLPGEDRECLTMGGKSYMREGSSDWG